MGLAFGHESTVHLPALTEATSPYFRPIKYSLFPPLGLATLAAYLGTDDEAKLCDEHVEPLTFDDSPHLVILQVYTTATFHILTPYPGTRLFADLAEKGRILHRRWDLYDTRHVVYCPRGLSAAALENGYWRAFEAILKGIREGKPTAIASSGASAGNVEPQEEARRSTVRRIPIAT